MPASAAAIPLLGLGTWPLAGGEAERAVADALACGYRHIDTAQRYGNEEQVGAALAASGLPRDEVFVVTKVAPPNYGPEDFMASVRRSAAALQVDAVDLLLLHWPPKEHGLEQTLDLLGAAVGEGLAHAAGVSNFPPSLLRAACARLPLAANQVEFHPLLDQRRIASAAAELNVALVAYSPLAKGEAAAHPEIAYWAQQLGCEPAQVALAWVRQHGVAAVAKTASPERMAANLASLQLSLPQEAMERIDGLRAAMLRITSHPDLAVDWEDAS